MMQTTLIYNEWFKIYKMQNSVQIILDHSVHK